jgi:thiol-disulfide isomerase/thioredoxin
MRRGLPLLAVSLVAVATSGARPASAADAPPVPRPAYMVGDVIEDFTLKVVGGGEFKLSDARTIDDAKAWAAVAAAAKEVYGADLKADDTTAFDALPGGKTAEGKVDEEKRAAFARAAVRPFGMLPSDKSLEDWKSPADVAKAIVASAGAPIVVYCWYSHCPTSQLYEERFELLAKETGARVYPMNTKVTEKEDAIIAYTKEKKFPFMVLDDRDLVVTDRLGGRRTPHAFLLDAKNVLRYAGAVDDDAAMTRPEGQRTSWLKEAALAVAAGKGVKVLQTSPEG